VLDRRRRGRSDQRAEEPDQTHRANPNLVVDIRADKHARVEIADGFAWAAASRGMKQDSVRDPRPPPPQFACTGRQKKCLDRFLALYHFAVAAVIILAPRYMPEDRAVPFTPSSYMPWAKRDDARRAGEDPNAVSARYRPRRHSPYAEPPLPRSRSTVQPTSRVERRSDAGNGGSEAAT